MMVYDPAMIRSQEESKVWWYGDRLAAGLKVDELALATSTAWFIEMPDGMIAVTANREMVELLAEAGGAISLIHWSMFGL